MNLRDPIHRIYTGKRGRPAAVRRRALAAIADHLFLCLPALGVSDLVPIRTRRQECRRIAQGIVARMEVAEVSLMASPLVREMALLLNQPAPASTSLAPTVGTDTNQQKES